jgi:uncharacterized protein YydD (DUF2326 family)
MFLKSLNIRGSSGEIRHIEFQTGVNLIVDNTENPDESGNNVGKTTILRLVDFCLAGDGKNIYTDPEFKDESTVKDFLVNNEVVITLVLTDSLEISNARTLKIERNFLQRGRKIQRINGEKFPNKEFATELALQLFNHSADKPKIRQLIAKNIRDEKDRLSNILKVLNNYTSDVEYETLYQFWFGIYAKEGEAYRKATDDHRKQTNYRTKLAKEFSITGFTVLPDIEKRIHELDIKKDSLDLPKDYQKQLEDFDQLKAELAQKAIQQSAIRLRIELIEESKKSLEDDLSKVSVDEIRSLYDEAKILIPGLQKSFEESVQFHNQMIANKLSFITKELPDLHAQERNLIKTINELEQRANEYKDLLKKDSTLVALEKINTELRELTSRKAKLSEQKRIWDECLSELERLDKKLESFADKSAALNEQVDEKLELFNPFFKRISKELYNTEYVLKRAVVDSKGEPAKFLKFEITGVTSNPGTGEKKGHITAFDLAYIEFAEKLNIPHLNFIMHDQIENVDGRQIVTILEELVPSIHCQYIAPILKDKIPEGVNIERDAIIELSQEEKLFKF